MLWTGVRYSNYYPGLGQQIYPSLVSSFPILAKIINKVTESSNRGHQAIISFKHQPLYISVSLFLCNLVFHLCAKRAGKGTESLHSDSGSTQGPNEYTSPFFTFYQLVHLLMKPLMLVRHIHIPQSKINAI